MKIITDSGTVFDFEHPGARSLTNYATECGISKTDNIVVAFVTYLNLYQEYCLIFLHPKKSIPLYVSQKYEDVVSSIDKLKTYIRSENGKRP